MYPNLTLTLRRGWFLLLIKLFYMLVLCRFRNKWITSFKEDTCEVQFLRKAAAASVKSLQSCPTLCDPIDGSPPGSPVSGILRARTLEWVAISFSNAWKWKVKVKLLSHVQLFATPRTVAGQAPPSMRFFRQEYWTGLPFPSRLIL